MTGEQSVKFALRDWLWLITIIAGAAVSNVTFIYVTAEFNRSDMLSQMERLDGRWQKRIGDITADIRSDLVDLRSDVKGVKESIPPDWFRKMVERNQADISELRKLLNGRADDG